MFAPMHICQLTDYFKKRFKEGAVAPLVECLPSMCEAQVQHGAHHRLGAGAHLSFQQVEAGGSVEDWFMIIFGYKANSRPAGYK